MLGAKDTGKTTLIRYWQTHKPPKLTVTGPADLSGSENAWPAWQQLVRRSRCIVYLIDARALCGCLDWLPRRNFDRLQDDMVQIGQWAHGHAARCLLVVTHTDQDCRRRIWDQDEGGSISDETYRANLDRQLQPLMAAFDAEVAVEVLTANLRDEGSAAALTTRIVERLSGR